MADTHSTTLPALVAHEGPAGPAFRFDGRWLRVYIREDGEPVFDARDVYRELGYSEAAALTRRLDPDEKGLHSVQTPGGMQEVSVVTEPGLYRAIASRRQVTSLGVALSDRVQRFQRWVFHEVLPTIRKTGSYGRPAAPSMPAMVEFLKNPSAVMEVLGHYASDNMRLAGVVERQAEALAVAEPKVEAFDALMAAEGLLTLSNAGRAIGADHEPWFKWLREVYLFHEGGALMPRAQFRKMNVFEIRTREVGGIILPQTYVTPRGLEFLRRRWADKVATDARVALVVRAQATLDL
ncbi:phage antirepressor [Methylobacterium hispanicum]|uniref:phage antirepressor n=1 Tax=Methylobacterium hispanicum TaxID=270350 RepID=UPI002F2D77D4